IRHTTTIGCVRAHNRDQQIVFEDFASRAVTVILRRRNGQAIGTVKSERPDVLRHDERPKAAVSVILLPVTRAAGDYAREYIHAAHLPRLGNVELKFVAWLSWFKIVRRTWCKSF